MFINQIIIRREDSSLANVKIFQRPTTVHSRTSLYTHILYRISERDCFYIIFVMTHTLPIHKVQTNRREITKNQIWKRQNLGGVE